MVTRYTPKRHIPSYRGGYAAHGPESEAPGEWRLAHNMWVPALGDRRGSDNLADLGSGHNMAVVQSGVPIDAWDYDVAYGGSPLELNSAFAGRYLQTSSQVCKTALNELSVVFVWKSIATSGFQMFWWEGAVAGNGGGGEDEIHFGEADVTIGATDRLAFFVQGDGDTINIVQNPFTDLADYHVSICRVRDIRGATVLGEFLLDGVSVGTDTCTGPIDQAAFDTDFRIGRPGTNDRFANIFFAQCRTYTRWLEDRECAEIFDDHDRAFRRSRRVFPGWVKSGGAQTIEPASLDRAMAMVAPTLLGTGSAPISPASLDRVMAMVAPELSTTGDQTIEPAALDRVMAMVAPVVAGTGSAPISPASLDRIMAMVAPVIAGTGSAPITPASLDRAMAMVAPTLLGTGSAPISPASLDRVMAMVAPVIAGTGSAPISPASLDRAMAMVAPVIAGTGSAPITPASLDRIMAMVAPVISTPTGDQTIEPAALDRVMAMVAPVIAGTGSASIEPASLDRTLAMVAFILGTVAGVFVTLDVRTAQEVVLDCSTAGAVTLDVSTLGSVTLDAQ